MYAVRSDRTVRRMTSTLSVPDVAPAPPASLSRREEIAFVVFPAWVVLGLFVDGWAHNADKPETFWSPWHALLYSGFVAGMLWGLVDNRRHTSTWTAAAREMTSERVAGLGILLFAGGGVADGVWHSIFGIEADVEALVSPSHLLLMVGGLLLTTTSLRSAWRGSVSDRPTLRAFLPAALSLTMAVAVVSFFLQFGSAFRLESHLDPATDGPQLVAQLLAIQVTNVLLVVPVLLVLRRWQPPGGAFVILFSLHALLLTGLLGFEQLPLVAPALAGGVVADLLIAARRRPQVVATIVPFVLWTAWFAVYELVWGLGWSVELWSGTIVFAVLAGWVLALLAFPPLPAPQPPSPAASAGR